MATKSRKPGDKNPSTMSRFTNYSSKLKLIFILLLIFTSIVSLFLFLPSHFFPLSTTLNLTPCPTSTSTSTSTSTTPSPPPQQPTDHIFQNGVVRRSFYPVGTAAYNFVFMSAYRGGPTTFAIMGLSSKPLHNFGHPTYTCEYRTNNGVNYKVKGKKLDFQDFGYARVYLVVVINCTFPNGVDDPSIGGRLLLHASTNGGYDKAVNSTDTIVTLIEPQNSWEPSQFLSPPKYDYLYCGGSLFGDLSPQRIREWIAYHVRLFGKRSHFVIHDAGGVHSEVMEVLKPWMELGYVSVEDIREQERFDGFYHNQMVVLNDCLHRYRFDTKWMFFFDVDEYIYLGEKVSIEGLMESVKDYTMVIIPQVSMSNRLCLAQDSPQFSKYVSSTLFCSSLCLFFTC